MVDLRGLERGLLGGQLGRVGVDDGVERGQGRGVRAGRRGRDGGGLVRRRREGRHRDGDRRGHGRGGAEEGARGGEQQQQRREAGSAARGRRLHRLLFLKDEKGRGLRRVSVGVERFSVEVAEKQPSRDIDSRFFWGGILSFRRPRQHSLSSKTAHAQASVA